MRIFNQECRKGGTHHLVLLMKSPMHGSYVNCKKNILIKSSPGWPGPWEPLPGPPIRERVRIWSAPADHFNSFTIYPLPASPSLSPAHKLQIERRRRNQWLFLHCLYHQQHQNRFIFFKNPFLFLPSNPYSAMQNHLLLLLLLMQIPRPLWNWFLLEEGVFLTWVSAL